MLADRALGESDFSRIGDLHSESIDDSLPALLGPRFGARMYGYLARSTDEMLFIEPSAGPPQSVCVVSFEPGSLQRRIALATWPTLLVRALSAFIRLAAFRRWFQHAAVHALLGEAEIEAPEITYIFTNRELRGLGLGARLVERVDAHLQARSIKDYWVKTLDDPANRAVSFYEDNGFVRVGTRSEGGRRFVVLNKKLDAQRKTTSV